MKHTEIIKIIEKTAPLYGQADWDNSGVQVASFASTLIHVGVMLDPTFAQIEKAVQKGVDFIVTHHPLSMTPRYPNEASDYLRILGLLLEKKIWLYSAHTSLDVQSTGPVTWLGKELGLLNMALLEKVGVDAENNSYGYGFIGDLPKSLDEKRFTRLLAEKLKCSGWNVCGPKSTLITRVACCPGSGSSFMPLAKKGGADVLITGDVKYHVALEAPLLTYDVGHFVLEEEMMRHFALLLGQQLTVPVTFFSAKDPITFADAF